MLLPIFNNRKLKHHRKIFYCINLISVINIFEKYKYYRTEQLIFCISYKFHLDRTNVMLNKFLKNTTLVVFFKCKIIVMDKKTTLYNIKYSLKTALLFETALNLSVQNFRL